MRKRAILNLIDGINGFPFAGTAAEHKNARNQVEVSIVCIMKALTLAVLPENNAGNADRFPAVTAVDASEMLQ